MECNADSDDNVYFSTHTLLIIHMFEYEIG